MRKGGRTGGLEWWARPRGSPAELGCLSPAPCGARGVSCRGSGVSAGVTPAAGGVEEASQEMLGAVF